MLILRSKGYNIAHRSENTFFADLAQRPQRAQRYAEAMQWFNTGPGLEPSHLLDAFPWYDVGDGAVVDVGGGYGSFSIALAERFPSLRCIVQDRAGVVAEGQAKLATELAGRVHFMAHDFFTDQPAMDVSAFFLRWILHDWSDKYAIKILRALIPALRAGAKVLVNEMIVPEPGSTSKYREKTVR
ncbi:MAG: hypothetical protein Q9208_003427 [Pyrenodesmia sp. 3 TL-2023]